MDGTFDLTHSHSDGVERNGKAPVCNVCISYVSNSRNNPMYVDNAVHTYFASVHAYVYAPDTVASLVI